MERQSLTGSRYAGKRRLRGTRRHRFAVLAEVLALSLVVTGFSPCTVAEEEVESEVEQASDRPEKLDDVDVERRVGTEEDIEIEGVIIDRTKTPTGRRFYQEFSADWVENLSAMYSRANLLIEERPSRSSTSLLTIRDEQDLLFSTVLTPRIVGIQETAEQAAATVRQRLILKAISRSDDEQEIERDLIGEGY